MADNPTIHNGATGDGTAFTAVGDEITSPYTGGTATAQGIKILSGAANSAEVIEGTAAYGLEVDVTRVATNTYEQTQNSSGLTTGATPYAIGDTLGAGWTFTNAVAASAGEARLTGVVLLDKGDVTVAVDLWFASASITFGTDNAAPSISDTDAEKIVGTVSVSMQDLGSNRIGTWSGAMPYTCDATSLFVYAITRAAHNQFAAATDLRLKLFAEL